MAILNPLTSNVRHLSLKAKVDSFLFFWTNSRNNFKLRVHRMINTSISAIAMAIITIITSKLICWPVELENSKLVNTVAVKNIW